MLVAKDYFTNKKSLKPHRQALRTTATPAERRLWLHLKNNQLQGRKFRRQFSVHNYILDFYCPAEQLAVELDGAHHYTTAGRLTDMERDAFLRAQGIRVLRFENRLVFEQMQAVLEEIEAAFYFEK